MRIHHLVEAVISSRKKGTRGALGGSRQYAARSAVWAVPTTERCSLACAVASMCLPCQGDPEAVDPYPVSSSVLHVYDEDIDA